jgi:hypothetical protein
MSKLSIVHLPFQLRRCDRVDKHNHADEQVEAQRVVMIAEETEIQSLKGKIDTILVMSGQKDTENQRLRTVAADNEQLIVQLNRDIKALNRAFIFLVRHYDRADKHDYAEERNEAYKNLKTVERNVRQQQKLDAQTAHLNDQVAEL